MADWANFYVIVGSSGGALIGLQFVVMTLIADRRQRTLGGALSAFGTPTVVHLTGALVVSAFMSVPWPSRGPLSAVLGVFGACGVAYGAIVLQRARIQTDYQPVWQDWLWYMALPDVVYTALVISAFVLRTNVRAAQFLIGFSALALLLIGIHNAWDTVTHIVVSENADA